VKDYGLEKIVEFRGSVVPEKMPPLMNEIDIHVVCSKQPEGLSIVLLEAMACGKAVISFAEGGPLDILVNGVNGLLVSPRDTQKLAEAIVALANDSKLRSTLGAEARRTVVGRFRAEKTAGRVEEIYRKIVRECRLWEERRAIGAG
jgi:glycosyltransferase involved in cell wall biosynthesis